MTVYRDGSRIGILNTRKTVGEVENFDYISAHKRPKDVEVDVYFKKALGSEHIFFVGVVDNKPYEVMGIPYSKDLGLPRSVKKGTLTKVGKGKYKFISERGFVIDNVIELMNETEQHQTRSWSMMLRHRINPSYIIKDIRQYASIVSFEKAVMSVLSNYSEDDVEIKCPECGGNMSMTEGCSKCTSCGYAKCG